MDTPMNRGVASAENAEAVMQADAEMLQLEGMRADLDDPRGYGNSFVSAWRWLRGKWRKRK